MIKVGILLGVLASSVFGVETFSIPVKGEPFPVPDELLQYFSVETGFKGSIELNVLRQAAGVWFDTIIQVVNGITIPNFSSDGDYMKDNTFYVEQRISGVTLSSDVGKNAVVLNCNQLTAKFRCNDFHYHIAPLMNANGYVEVDMNSVDIGFGL
jgi:hypothetical protein